MKPLIMEDEVAELPSVWRKRFLTALKEITDDDTKDEQHNTGGVVPLACKSLEISFLLKLCMGCHPLFLQTVLWGVVLPWTPGGCRS
ncbi:unnamed protein product [Rhizophagus irregularis]|nr:unnamed protein product [Rhizophagus irregularis]